jgi:general secretion pathway protein E
MEQALISRLKVMARMDIAEKRLPQDGMAKVRVGEREIDIRVSTLPVAEGERVVLRLLNQESTMLPLEALGMPAGMFREFRALIHSNSGIVLVCGPTGSGKTTTLYAALQELDTKRQNILTIEDPIEYQLPDIGQMQVKPKIGLTFADGLRHILRQDPDIILVGETRDIETAEIAIRASLTGHLVLTTLHTNDALSAVIRMLDMGVEPYLLSSSLLASLAQRLVRRLCDECKVSAEIPEDELQGFGERGALLAGKQVLTGRGCSSCLGGYRGRIGLFEFMVMESDLQTLLRSGHTTVQQMRETARRKGMTDLAQDGITKVLDGRTSVAEVLRVVGAAGSR